MQTENVQAALCNVGGHASEVIFRRSFGRQDLEAAHEIESGIDLRRQANVHDVAEGGRGGQAASLEAPVAVIDRSATRVPSGDLKSALRQLDEQSSGATGRLEHTVHTTAGI